MRLLPTLLLLLASAAARGADAPALPPCEPAVRFVADWFADPPQEFDKSSGFLAKQGASAAEGATALGLVTVENAISVVPEKSCRGLRVSLRFVHPVLRVIRELPPGSCAHAHVLRHEYTHVHIYREMARQFRELVYPFPDSATPDDVLHYAKQQLAKLQEAQRLFDSPEEYAGNLTACKGEIPRLLAAAKKAG
ncbi:hypothetical protein [Scleromatobacter humisilvae]|uniref:DUF922 domain-containing protein n=1 Tax=Scleromatobacter humisilvae TaxID=2897159 RepID=A0A9X2C1G6_9BURK|nr:hypothetical protein [Scleromatobacter humisilvae]MCK9684965.1 hypothetical protein [Scleromatobacter humisilvae]